MKTIVLVTILALGGGLCQAFTTHVPGEVGSLPVLLGHHKIQEAVGLSPAQVRSLANIRARYEKSAAVISSQAKAPGGDRRVASKEFDALRVSTNKQALALLSKEQVIRLAAVEHKLLGATLLYVPSVQKKIGITPSQATQIAEIRAGASDAAAGLNRRYEQGAITEKRRLALLRADRVARGEQILRLLTPLQRDAFRALSRPSLT